MRLVSLRNLLLHKLRLLLTVAAVSVGVAFVSGTFVLSDTMNKAFEQLYAGLTAGTDVSVRGQPAFTDVSFDSGRPLPERLVGVVRGVPGVAEAEGSVTGFALILDKHGAPVQPGGAPTLGTSIGHSKKLAGDFSFRSGRTPSGPGEVVVDAGTAKKAGYRVGDSVDVVLQDRRQTFTVVGVVGFGDTDSLAGATLAGFDMPTAQKLLGKVGKVDGIDVGAKDGVSAEQLRDDIAQVVPDGVQVLTGEQVADRGAAAVREGMAIFTKVLLAFAAVSLFVGSFVIWNTFNVLVAQRRRQVALLRAVGATRRQVLGGILIEAGVIGLVSAAFGLLAGVGLAAGIRGMLKLIGTEVPTTSVAMEPRTVVAALLVGIVVTLIAAVIPAWTATRVAPMEALRDATPTTGEISRVRRDVGWAVLAAGIVGLIVCAAVGGQLVLTGLAALAAFGGLVVVGPVLAVAIARLADRGRRGSEWRIAARNVSRASRRSAATALALTIGLTVVSAVAVSATSMKASVIDSVSGNGADLILQPAGAGSGISPVAADLLRHRHDVADVVELRYSPARIGGRATSLVGLNTQGLSRVVDLGMVDGKLDLRPGRILVEVGEARALGVSVGDRIPVTFLETGERPMAVAGTFSRDSITGSPYVVSLQDFSANVTSRLDAAILLTTTSTADLAATEESVTRALADYPNVTVSNQEELTKQSQASVDQLLGLVTALLCLAVLVAVLGIVNTLVLSVVERTRELGLMRAVGATRNQLRSIVRRESVLLSLLGAGTGISLGTLTGVALSRALADEGITRLAVPTATLAVYVVVAAVVGVLAAIGPARRASNVDVLQAVTVE